MADDSRSPRHPPGNHQLEREIGRKAERHRHALREGDRGIWYTLGLMGFVGWSISVPTLLGVALGQWIDHRWPGHVSWTLTLLALGLAIGCAHVWRWISTEDRNDD